LWRLTGVPPISARGLKALRSALHLGARGGLGAARQAVERLEPTVSWVADEHLITGPPATAVLIELVDLMMASVFAQLSMSLWHQ
jgi:hypothetical protein